MKINAPPQAMDSLNPESLAAPRGADYADDSLALVASVAYVAGKRSHEVPLERVAAYLAGMAQRRRASAAQGSAAEGQAPASTSHLLWLALQNPHPRYLTQALNALGLSEKSQEEILHVHRRPKVLDYGDAVLVVAITVDMVNERPVFGETQYLIGVDYLVTVRRGLTTGYAEVRAHLESNAHLLKRGGDYVATELLDHLIDRYVAVASTFETMVELAEQKLLIRGAKDADIRKVYRHRRDLLRIQTAIAPLVEIGRRLAHVHTNVIDREAQMYFNEVADRASRLDEFLRALRESLAFAFEASLMLGQTAQNDITRKLAAWAAILAVPTAIAGIYGMNFAHMPELAWTWGYPMALLLMFGICSALYRQFRRVSWL